MIALGIASRLLGFTIEQVFAPIEKRLARQGDSRHRSQPRRDQGRLRRGGRYRVRATTRHSCFRAAPAGGCCRGTRQPRSAPSAAAFVCRRLSDHARDGNPRMALAEAFQNRRGAAAGRGRTRRNQHDHRLIVWRHAGPDGDFRTRPLADDRSARPRHRRRNSGRGRRCHAWRSIDGHSHQIRTDRPEYRHLRPARRRAPSRAGAAIGRRLPVHDTMGDLSRGNAASAGHRSVRPVHGTVTCRHRTSRRRCVYRCTDGRHRYIG